MADKIKGGNVEIDDTIEINDVLLVGSRVHSTFGRPYIPGAKVIATVEELTKDKKVVVMKFRRRKNSKRTKGHRRELTVLRITDIIEGEGTESNSS